MASRSMAQLSACLNAGSRSTGLPSEAFLVSQLKPKSLSQFTSAPSALRSFEPASAANWAGGTSQATCRAPSLRSAVMASGLV